MTQYAVVCVEKGCQGSRISELESELTTARDLLTQIWESDVLSKHAEDLDDVVTDYLNLVQDDDEEDEDD